MAYVMSSVSNVDLLGAEDLENLCTVTCRAALVDLKSVIESSCTAANDVMVKDEVAYPGILDPEADGVTAEADSSAQLHISLIVISTLTIHPAVETRKQNR